MWKELIICAVIVIVIIVGNVITQNYTVTSVETLNSSLMNLREKIEKNEENIEQDEVKEEMNKIFAEWENRHNKLAYYIEHDELEKVEDDLTSLNSYIETKEHAEAVSQLERCAFVLRHIQDKYAFNLENIF